MNTYYHKFYTIQTYEDVMNGHVKVSSVFYFKVHEFVNKIKKMILKSP